MHISLELKSRMSIIQVGKLNVSKYKVNGLNSLTWAISQLGIILNVRIFHRFEGRWEACSVFDAVEAPLGEEVFGGKPVLTAAEKDLQSKLSYPVLFKTLMPDQIPAVVSAGISNSVISDRLYNVEQIALASMGPNSIIDDAQKVHIAWEHLF